VKSASFYYFYFFIFFNKKIQNKNKTQQTQTQTQEPARSAAGSPRQVSAHFGGLGLYSAHMAA
jgi:hypothetical protein